ncbi:MAG TPA: ATP-binding protein [Tepidisphaeraceae bacterium]|jgi:two-component system phosphate regulon sensor histidine kinase PhoR
MSGRSHLLRLVVPFAAMIVAVVALSGWLIYRSGAESARRMQRESLANDARLIAHEIARHPAPLEGAPLARVAEVARLRDVRVTLVDAGGRVVFDTRSAVEEMDDHNDRPEIVAARRDGEGAAVRSSRSLGVSYVYAARRAADGLVVRASRPEAGAFEVGGVMIAQLAAAVALCVLMMTGLAVSLQRRWIAPVRRLADAASHMAAGEFGTRVEPAGESELRTFSSSLNDLATRAEKQLIDLRQGRADLASLVDSMPDPILLTDRQQRVVLINQPAADFLQVTTRQANGAKLVSLLGEPLLVELAEGLPATPGVPHVRDLRVSRLGQKLHYQAVAARTNAGGVLLVLRDVSKLVSAVQMKTDFVANASHELRTPIAAIKLAFDTLTEVLADDPQQTLRCIQIIAGHLKRLEDMLADLLDLSRVENESIRPEIAPLLAREPLAIVRSTMTPLALDRGVTLTIEADEAMQMHSDRRLLDLILKNLVENGIKYTPAGGSVRMALRREIAADGPHVLLSVTDTGIGIPPQHLERVFERFYQVDAARSGSAARGTGLGLAIVKHAVAALGGQVKIDSLVGRGTTVTCVLPDTAALSAVSG